MRDAAFPPRGLPLARDRGSRSSLSCTQFRARSPCPATDAYPKRIGWRSGHGHGTASGAVRGERLIAREGETISVERTVSETGSGTNARSNYPVGLREQIAVAVIINQD